MPRGPRLVLRSRTAGRLYRTSARARTSTAIPRRRLTLFSVSLFTRRWSRLIRWIAVDPGRNGLKIWVPRGRLFSLFVLAVAYDM